MTGPDMARSLNRLEYVPVKELPILFSAPMVRAILEGRKTQTRRILKPRKDRETGCELAACELAGEINAGDYRNSRFVPGDRLWVRETWGVGSRPHPIDGWYDGIEYRADVAYLNGSDLLPCHKMPDDIDLSGYREGWHPSIHMPRWASRIDLEITAVRAERLQTISFADAVAEGWIRKQSVSKDPQVHADAARDWFSDLWVSINGPESWQANPIVQVVEFKVVRP